VPLLDLAALRAHLARRRLVRDGGLPKPLVHDGGLPPPKPPALDPSAARFLGSALASTLAEDHVALDAEGSLAPVLRGALGVWIDETGAVLLDDGPGPEGASPELLAGSRLTPRSDVYALGTLLLPLLPHETDPELLAALALATDPLPARRRVTCVELEALLARGADLAAGRLALAEAVRDALAEPEAPPSSRPLPAAARAAVALATAAAVFAVGVAAVEGWGGR
jgi:hypothetical protein